MLGDQVSALKDARTLDKVKKPIFLCGEIADTAFCIVADDLQNFLGNLHVSAKCVLWIICHILNLNVNLLQIA